MRQVLSFLLIFCLFSSLWSLILCGLDKSAAKKGRRRVPEKKFFLLAVLGGGCGLWLGMRLFHHNTRQLSFRIIAPLTALIQLAGLTFLAVYCFPF